MKFEESLIKPQNEYYNSMLKVISWNKMKPALVYWMKNFNAED